MHSALSQGLRVDLLVREDKCSGCDLPSLWKSLLKACLHVLSNCRMLQQLAFFELFWNSNSLYALSPSSGLYEQRTCRRAVAIATERALHQSLWIMSRLVMLFQTFRHRPEGRWLSRRQFLAFCVSTEPERRREEDGEEINDSWPR